MLYAMRHIVKIILIIIEIDFKKQLPHQILATTFKMSLCHIREHELGYLTLKYT